MPGRGRPAEAGNQATASSSAAIIAGGPRAQHRRTIHTANRRPDQPWLDPCAGTAPITNADLRAVCLAQGAPAGSIGLITDPTAAQANIVTGGNIELEPEKANTWTLGVVFQPEFLPRFSVSLDYYNIRVKDLIGAPTPGDSSTPASETSPPPAQRIRTASSSGVTRHRRPRRRSGNHPGPVLARPTTRRTVHRRCRPDHELQDQRRFRRLSWSFTGNWTNNSKFNANVRSGWPQPRMRRTLQRQLLLHRLNPAEAAVLAAHHPVGRQGRFVAAVALDRQGDSSSRSRLKTMAAPTKRYLEEFRIDPVGTLFRPDGPLQRDRQHDLHRDGPEYVQQSAEGGWQHDRLDHVQQRQRLPVDLRRAGSPLRCQRKTEVLKFPEQSTLDPSGRPEMAAPFFVGQ